MVRNISHASSRVAMAIAGVALLATTAGCGGGDAAAKKALSDAMMKKSNLNGITRSQADCVAGKIVDGIGVSKLQHYGVLAKSGQTAKSLDQAKLSSADANTAASAVTGCTDAVSLMVKSFSQHGMTPSQASCVKQNVTNDDVQKALAAGYSGHTSDSDMGPIAAKLKACSSQ